MRVLTAYPERLGALKRIYLAQSAEHPAPQEYTLRTVRMHQGYALITLKGIDDRTTADMLRQLFVMVAIDDAIPREEGEHYLFELIGLTVVTEDGVTLGLLQEILDTGANDVYVVGSPEYGEVLIPATEHTILKTDIAAQQIIVRLPEGLLP